MAYQQRLAQAFERHTREAARYKPTPAQLTIGYIAQHLASDNYFYCDQFGAMKSQRSTDETSTADSVKATWPKDKLVTQLKQSFKFCEDALAQLDDEARRPDDRDGAERGSRAIRAAAAWAVGHDESSTLTSASTDAGEQHPPADGAAASAPARLMTAA